MKLNEFDKSYGVFLSSRVGNLVESIDILIDELRENLTSPIDLSGYPIKLYLTYSGYRRVISITSEEIIFEDDIWANWSALSTTEKYTLLDWLNSILQEELSTDEDKA